MGALNFHQTKVQMSNIIVKKISSEDGINIINSTFNISDIKFTEKFHLTLLILILVMEKSVMLVL